MLVSAFFLHGLTTMSLGRAFSPTNMRAAGSDDLVLLAPPRHFSLEQAIEYIEQDELVEVTPKNIRLRKKFLNEHDRKRASKN
jgi:GTP-binding protein